jgi:hypothetical protein
MKRELSICLLLLLVQFALPVAASAQRNAAAASTIYKQMNLASDIPRLAAFTQPALQNLSGDTVAAGAPSATTNYQYQGAIYVFAKPPGGWKSTSKFNAKISNIDGGFADGFGSSMALLGNTLVGGAPGHNSSQGAAYVLLKPTSDWKSTSRFNARLTPSDATPSDMLGQSLSINRNTIVAGAIQFPNPTPTGPGAAFVFVRPPGGWTDMTQTAKLIASDGVPGDELGWSLFIGGSKVVAGARLASIGRAEFEGAPCVFVKPARGRPKKMTQTVKLVRWRQNARVLGDSVSAIDNMLIVGADSYCSGCPSGAGYVFGRTKTDDAKQLNRGRLRSPDTTETEGSNPLGGLVSRSSDEPLWKRQLTS